MLRQLLHIAFSVMILVTTTGISVKKHYCLGKIRYTTLAILDNPCCDPGEKMPVDCCKDIIEHYQVDEDFQPVSVFEFTSLELEAPVFQELETQFTLSEPSPSHYLTYRPPLIDQDVPVLIQSFLC